MHGNVYYKARSGSDLHSGQIVKNEVGVDHVLVPCIGISRLTKVDWLKGWGGGIRTLDLGVKT